MSTFFFFPFLNDEGCFRVEVVFTFLHSFRFNDAMTRGDSSIQLLSDS